MKVQEVMTPLAITISPDASVVDAASLMDQHRISGLPVVDSGGKLVGMISDTDFLRRAELGTEIKRSKVGSVLAGPEAEADEYVKSHARRVSEMMTERPATVESNDELDVAIRLMERRQIRRVPVMKDGEIVGILSRANLVQALASIIRGTPELNLTDQQIRERVLAELAKINWAFERLINVTVKEGVVDLWGSYTAFKQDEAAVTAAENVPGVKAVNNHLSWVDPISGAVVYNPTTEIAQQI